MILSSVTSSPDESLASNLHLDTVLLSSLRQASREIAPGRIRSHWKKLCNDERAAEVIGPVDNGDRIMAKKGPIRVVRGNDRMSVKGFRASHAFADSCNS